MKSKEFQDKMQSMLDTIGDDKANLILDSVGELMTDNEKMNADLQTKDDEIKNLKAINQTLQKVNGNLLQQVAVADEPQPIEDVREKQKLVFNMRDCFDEKGNFKR